MSVELGRTVIDPPVFLAPMAGASDAPFRELALRGGAGLVVSEMVASGEVVRGRPSARARADLGFGSRRTAVQLAGRDPGWMAEAARYCAGQGAEIIDLNFGCPAKKVTNGLSGSALMREPDLALRLIEAVAGAVDVPVTVKMRLGWDADTQNAPEIATRAEAAGVRMITVHGRTRCQFYAGRADWTAIARVKAAVRVPVIANGDIVDAATARAALALSGADGVMIGRGARGRPWLVGQVAALLAGRTPRPAPKGAALAAHVCAHYQAMLGFYGRDLGLRVARKHLGWYLDHVPGSGALRARILRLTDPGQVLAALGAGLEDSGATPAVAA
jgi:nifR3 family TIM-barrel protein